MEETKLEVTARETKGKKVKTLKAKGIVPAVVYGKGLESISIEVDGKKLAKTLKTEAGLNILITLEIDTKGKITSLPVITHDLQIDPLTDKIIHVDFRHIIMDEAIKTKVPVNLIGEAPGVKTGGGVLVHSMREIEVKCLPAKIPAKIDLDISALEVGDSLHVSNLMIDKDITLLTPLEELVAAVVAPTKLEEVAPLPEAIPAEGAVPTEGAVPGEEGAAAPTTAEKKGPEGAKPAKEEKPAREAKPAREEKKK